MAKKLWKGNNAIAEAAIQAGCRYFFGYPITPQNEIPEYLAKRLPEEGGSFVQAESEVSAINMVYGAAGAGARVMTSSSGPGISLKQEGISYIAGAQLPCVIVNIMRGGPGLGGIHPSQSDYFQATKGGGHGDYNLLVYAPGSVQEAVDLTQKAFDKADEYRNPVLIIADAIIGQMMEPAEVNPPAKLNITEKNWATTGWDKKSRGRNYINSLELHTPKLEQHNISLQEKYRRITDNEVMAETFHTDDAEIILVAYGTTARIAKSAIRAARAKGIKAGLVRPITLWPFPEKVIQSASANAKAVLVVEMSAGQMLYDVKLAVNGKLPVHFHGRMGGMIPKIDDILAEIEKINGGNK